MPQDSDQSTATFIGVDLAWKSERNPSGLVVLRGDRTGATLHVVTDPIPSLRQVLAAIWEFSRGTTVVAVDAPLVIPNESGQRDCERLVGQRYGSRDASCHTSNLRLYPNSGSVELSRTLEAEGFVHAPSEEALTASRVIFEVFPHAALVALFNLDRVIKYKKGSVLAKRVGLEELGKRIRQLAGFNPPLQPTEKLRVFLSRDLGALRGQQLKNYEDALDALVCAYVAYYYWVWRAERTEVFGNRIQGYILNPTLQRTSLVV